MTNFCAKATNSIAKVTNSIANGMNSIAKVTNLIAKTCYNSGMESHKDLEFGLLVVLLYTH